MHYKVSTAVAAAAEPVTLAEARLQLRLPAIVTEEDSLITAWITAAREAAEHYTGRALAAQTLEAALDAFPCERYIDLPRPPVSSVTSIKYTDPAGDEQTMAAGDYSLSLYGDARRVNLASGASWPSTDSNAANAVRILFVTGYATAPQAVKAAILLMVTWLHENRGDQIDPDDIQPPAAKALLGTVKLWGR